MNKQLLKSLIMSVGIVLIISLTIGLAFYLLFGLKVGISFFIFSTIAQIIGGYWINSKKEFEEEIFTKEIVETIKQDPARFKVPVRLTCAYCHAENFVPLSLMEDNGFTCLECKEPNKVYIQYSTVRITKPLSPTIDLKEIDMEGEGTKTESAIHEPIETSNG